MPEAARYPMRARVAPADARLRASRFMHCDIR